MKKTQANRHLKALSVLVLALLVSLALPGPLRSQGTGSVVMVGLDPATGALVPVHLELVRRPGELRLDPRTGTLSEIGAVPEPDGPPALLAFDVSTGALVAVDLEPVRRPGQIKFDPRTGALLPEGLETPFPAIDSRGLTLVGFDPITRTLAPVEVGLAREPGSFALDPRSGTLSPAPSGPALVGFDAAAGAPVPVEVSPVRGRGRLSVDPRTGQMSSVDETPAPAQGTGSLTLLGIRSDAKLVPVDLDLVYRSGVLAIDPLTGLLSPPGEAPAQDPRASLLTMLGVHSPTGALTRVEVEPALKPGEYAINLASGTLAQVAARPEADDRADAFVFGVGLDVRQMLKLKDVLEEVGSVATGTDATELAPGIHGFAEYRWRAFSLGLEAAYSVMDTEVRFPQGLQTGDLSYYEIGGNVKIAVPLEGPVSPYGTFAILRAWSEADFEIDGLSEHRTHKTKRDGIGAGIDYWRSPHWGLRVEGLYNTTFEDRDAAEHIRWRLAVMYSPSGVEVGRDGN
ncbi:MAG TPA: porin family protein [Gemmatimonadota bacterium]|nr:porin family protein [Gemmatimonadota bacterium]